MSIQQFQRLLHLRVGKELVSVLGDGRHVDVAARDGVLHNLLQRRQRDPNAVLQRHLLTITRRRLPHRLV